MKIRLAKIAVLLLALAAFVAPSFAQQNTLSQTSLSSAVAGSLLGQGVTNTVNPPPQIIQVASATGMVGLNPNLGITASQPNQTALYIDRELMYVIAVNGTNLTVVRGAGGTIAVPHASGAMVLYGPTRFFYVNDPGGTPAAGTGLSGVSCTANNVVVSPWVNIRTGAQWLCSSQTSTWVPGFNNPMETGSSGVTASVASAAGLITPSGPLFHITGTAAITGFNIPVGFNATAVGGGTICAIPDGIFTTTTANNIALASTAVVNKLLCWTWDGKNSKFVPSY